MEQTVKARSFYTQMAFSATGLGFSAAMLLAGKDPSIYLPIFTSILFAWLPSPMATSSKSSVGGSEPITVGSLLPTQQQQHQHTIVTVPPLDPHQQQQLPTSSSTSNSINNTNNNTSSISGLAQNLSRMVSRITNDDVGKMPTNQTA